MSDSPYNRTISCEPTLLDQDVIDFCRNGYLMLPSVVSDDINRRVLDYLDNADSTHEPTPIMKEDWFVDGVLLNPKAVGAVRSLLGNNFTLPAIISNHRGPLPFSGQNWHRDGGSIYTPRLDYLQVFYIPEECTDEMGPTVVLPGSHFMRAKAPMMAHNGTIKGTVSTAGPAGSIFLTVYSIWHKRSRATATPTGGRKYRNLLKYNYWRTEQPVRDWKTDGEVDFNRAMFDPSAGVFEQFQGGIAAARMFCWLSGIEHDYEKRGGQCWPIAHTVRDGANQMGIPISLENRTD
ncbi:MAG: phytanoyl-CoA dioxygenase family protein [Gemmatimonadota bacterium]|nr:phytanoyl-CoA dioxygenase family protein [Gemmatimonadota bacterium]